jgi:hypothetical protein
MSENKDLTFEQIMKALEDAKPSWMADGKGLRGDAPKYKPLDMPRGEIAHRYPEDRKKSDSPSDYYPPCQKLRGFDLTYEITGIAGCGCYDEGGGLWTSATSVTFPGGVALWDSAIGLWVHQSSGSVVHNSFSDACVTPNSPAFLNVLFTTFIQCVAVAGIPKFKVLVTGAYEPPDGAGAPSQPSGSWPGADLWSGSVGFIAYRNQTAGVMGFDVATANDITCGGFVGGGTFKILSI